MGAAVDVQADQQRVAVLLDPEAGAKRLLQPHFEDAPLDGVNLHRVVSNARMARGAPLASGDARAITYPPSRRKAGAIRPDRSAASNAALLSIRQRNASSGLARLTAWKSGGTPISTAISGLSSRACRIGSPSAPTRNSTHRSPPGDP